MSTGSDQAGHRRLHARLGRVPARRIAIACLVLTVLCYGATALPGILLFTTGTDRIVSLALLLMVMGLQLGYFSRVEPRPSGPWAYLALLAYAALVVVPHFLYGPLWRHVPGMLAGNALLVLPMVVGVPVFVLVVLSLAPLTLATALFLAPNTPLQVSVGAIAGGAVAGIAVFGLTTLVRLVAEAEKARDEVRRTAVEQERLRIAGDLHDLLGQSLSAVALRGQLVARLMAEHADRARAELTEVLVLARAALSDVRTVVGVRRELGNGVSTGPPVSLLTPQLGVGLLAAVLLAELAADVVVIQQESGPLAATGLAAFRLAQVVLVLYLTQSRTLLPLGRAAGLGALALLTWGAPATLGYLAGHQEGVLIGTALVVLPRVLAGIVFVAAWAAAVGFELVQDSAPAIIAERAVNAAVNTMALAMTVYGLATVARLVADLRAARANVSQIAVARERVRLSQDVHDLLGLSLSAVALKTELVGKLVTSDPERARTELDQLLESARLALADVRSITSGHRGLSLPDECRFVEQTLSAADVRVTVTQVGELPEEAVASVLATVLREAATNVLRHSKAEWCEIVVGRRAGAAVLEVTNDVLDTPRTKDGPGGGNGLRNMRERVVAVGGELSTSTDGQLYRLAVRIPRRRLRAAASP